MDIVTKEWIKSNIGKRCCFSDAEIDLIYGANGLTRIQVLSKPLVAYGATTLTSFDKIFTLWHADFLTRRQMWEILRRALNRLTTTDARSLRVRDWMSDPALSGRNFVSESKDAIQVVDNGAGGHVGMAHALSIIAMQHFRKGESKEATKESLSALIFIFSELPDPTVGHQWAVDQLILMLTP